MTPSIHCESIATHADFRHLSTIDNIAVELRYGTANNFVGRDLYSPLDCAWVHRLAGAGLERAVVALAALRPECRLLVLDALRPQRIQEQLWAALQGTDLLQYLANPVRGSIHSFGMALDITIVDDTGRELDMGTPFDDLTDLSHPALEQAFLERGEIKASQIDHRALLRRVMTAGGFSGISTEWWHYDCGDRELVRSTFARVL